MTGLLVAMSLGVTVMASMPPTPSSCVVITEIVGSNFLWALVYTEVLNVFGSVTIPVVVEYIAHQGTTSPVSPVDLFLKLFLIVVIPVFLEG